jgi:tetratricopeptide (TPR) repeat protein
MEFADHWIGIYSGESATTPIQTKRNPAPLALPPTAEGKHIPPNDPSTLRPLFEQALAQRRARFGPESRPAARSAWLLGSFLKDLGSPDSALQPLRDALRIDRANRSPLAAEDAMQLAQALQATGKRQEAIDLFSRAARDGDPRVTAQSYASLAKLDAANAAAHYAKAVTAEQTASGEDSPRVAALLSNLALALRAKGELAPAETLLRRALRIQDEAFGRGNLQSAISMNNLGTVLQSMGKLREAESLERESAAIFERKLPCSIELAAAYANLADLLAASEGRVEAAAFLRRAIATEEAAGAKGTPEEAADLANLARLLSLSDSAAAKVLFQQALSIYELRNGPASPQAEDIRKSLKHLPSGPKQ